MKAISEYLLTSQRALEALKDKDERAKKRESSTIHVDIIVQDEVKQVSYLNNHCSHIRLKYFNYFLREKLMSSLAKSLQFLRIR